MIRLPAQFRNLPVVALLFVGLSINHASAAAPTGWPQWRGPNRDGHSPATSVNTNWESKPPKLEWQVEGLGKGYASVSVVDGKIFTSGNLSDGQAIIALSAQDGSQLWSTTVTDTIPKHGYGGSRTTPTVDGDHLYAVPSDGSIVCLKVSDGSVVWKKSFQEFGGKMMSGWGYSESPLVDGDWVLCTPGGKYAAIVALNRTTGELVWKAAMPDFITPDGKKPKKTGAGYSSIVVSNGAGVKQYVQLLGGGVMGVRASNGEVLWSYTGVANRTANIPTPVPSGDDIFVSSGYGTGSALLKLEAEGNGVKATEQYFLNAKTMQNHHGGMVKVGDHIYCGRGHGRGFPVCIEVRSGKVVWGDGIRGEGSGSAAVMYVDGHLIFRYESGPVVLIEATPKKYNMRGAFTPPVIKGKCWAHPVVVGDKLFLREQDTLMCYRLAK